MGISRQIIRSLLIMTAAFTLAVSPIQLFHQEVDTASAVGVGLIGGATTHSSFEDGKLYVGIEGGSAVKISVAETYYAQMQLPSSLGHLLENPDIRKHIRMKYSIPSPILGFIPITGEVDGDHLIFDKTNNLISGGVNIPASLSLIGIYQFTFEIDIASMEETVPLNKYTFKINVGDEQLDLPLLEFPESLTELEFEYGDSDEGDDSDDSEEGDGNAGTTASTKASVSFLPSDEAPPVVDPSDPDKPYEPDPEDPSDPQDPPTDNTGQLTLDYVSSVHFGKQKISSDTEIYESEVLRPFIQVSDRRKETDGWALQAQLGEFESADGNGEDGTLPGAVLTFSDGSLKSPGNTAEPHAYPKVELDSGGDESWVVWAEKDTGAGTWLNRWLPAEDNADKNENVTLEVPGGSATTGEHQATITWSLVDAPGQ